MPRHSATIAALPIPSLYTRRESHTQYVPKQCITARLTCLTLGSHVERVYYVVSIAWQQLNDDFVLPGVIAATALLASEVQ